MKIEPGSYYMAAIAWKLYRGGYRLEAAAWKH